MADPGLTGSAPSPTAQQLRRRLPGRAVLAVAIPAAALSVALSGRLSRWLPAGPRSAATTAATAASACVAGDLVLLAALLASTVAAGGMAWPAALLAAGAQVAQTAGPEGHGADHQQVPVLGQAQPGHGGRGSEHHRQRPEEAAAGQGAAARPLGGGGGQGPGEDTAQPGRDVNGQAALNRTPPSGAGRPNT
jgi:hypothetical protein